MPDASPIPCLTDIVEAIERIRSETADIPLDAFEGNWRKLRLVERGGEIISEASRHLPDDLKARHPEIPWRKPTTGFVTRTAGSGTVDGPLVRLHIGLEDLNDLVADLKRGSGSCGNFLRRGRLRRSSPLAAVEAGLDRLASARDLPAQHRSGTPIALALPKLL